MGIFVFQMYRYKHIVMLNRYHKVQVCRLVVKRTGTSSREHDGNMFSACSSINVMDVVQWLEGAPGEALGTFALFVLHFSLDFPSWLLERGQLNPVVASWRPVRPLVPRSPAAVDFALWKESVEAFSLAAALVHALRYLQGAQKHLWRSVFDFELTGDVVLKGNWLENQGSCYTC